MFSKRICLLMTTKYRDFRHGSYHPARSTTRELVSTAPNPAGQLCVALKRQLWMSPPVAPALSFALLRLREAQLEKVAVLTTNVDTSPHKTLYWKS